MKLTARDYLDLHICLVQRIEHLKELKAEAGQTDKDKWIQPQMGRLAVLRLRIASEWKAEELSRSMTVPAKPTESEDKT